MTYPANIVAINPATKIQVSDAASADALRDNLIDQIFNAGPLASPAIVVFHSTFNPAGTSWAGATNMASIEEWRVTVSRGFVSRLYRFKPTVYRNPTSGKGAMIVCAGHGQIGTYAPFQQSIAYLVASGYEVWTVDMPVSPGSLNAPPVVINDPIAGILQIRTHDDIQAMKTPSFNPLRVFLEPVRAIVDGLASRGVINVGMFGLSGGGWTTTLYAALDTRIKAAYSFAGTMPLYCRSWAPPHNSLGDWEQKEIGPLGADYLDLYVLAAHGRRFMNIHNFYDDCCFGGDVVNHYTAAVNAVVNTIGGSYDAAIDYGPTVHTIGSWGANQMWSDLALRF